MTEEKQQFYPDGCFVVMTGSAGALTALNYAERYRQELSERFPDFFLRKERKLRKEQEQLAACADSSDSGVMAWETFLNRGVFETLWILAERLGCGLEVDLYAIPISQFTIELCELYNLNPYTEAAGEGKLVITKKPEQLIFKEGCGGTVIGRLTLGRDRVVKNGEELRYLTPNGK